MKFISQLKLLCKVSPKGVVFTTLTALVSSFEASILALATIEVVDAAADVLMNDPSIKKAYLGE